MSLRCYPQQSYLFFNTKVQAQVLNFFHRMAELLKEMRYELDQLLAEKIQDPKLDLVTYGRGKLIIDTIVHLISTE